MAEIRWNVQDAPVNILTTELNALGDGANKISAALSNDDTAELDLYADFELYIGTTTAKDANAYVELYILTEMDGTNYVYGDDSIDPPATALVGIFRFPATVTACRDTLRGVVLPPTNFKVLLINETGQAFTATGNILSYARYNMQSA